jgi:hypothetical protein
MYGYEYWYAYVQMCINTYIQMNILHKYIIHTYRNVTYAVLAVV